MSTSGTTSFTQNRNDIVMAALRKLGYFDRGEPIPAENVQDAVEDFNRIIKSWNKLGYHLWKIEQVTLFLDTVNAQYVLSPTGSNCFPSDQLVETTLTASVSGGSTTVDVDSVAGLTVGKYIGVRQSDNTIHWTTIASIVSNTVGLTTGLTVSASNGAPVYVYTSKVSKPLRIAQARVRISNINPNQSDIVLTALSNTDYFGLPNKTARGVPVQFYYKPERTQGDFYIWPVNQDLNYRIEMSVESSIEDAGNITDDIDFPIEWAQALVWNLAYEMATEYGVDPETYARIESRARETLADASSWDIEDVSVQLAPDFYYGGEGSYR